MLLLFGGVVGLFGLVGLRVGVFLFDCDF